MLHSKLKTTLAIAAMLIVLPGCSVMESLLPSDDDGPEDVTELGAAIERVYVDAELAQKHARTAVEAVEAITASNFQGHATQAYKEFVQFVEQSEDQSEQLDESVEDMKDAAETVFDKWADNLKLITNVEMRQASRRRMLETRDRYDAIVRAVEPMQASYVQVNKSLKDHVLFLGTDFNPGAIEQIRGAVRDLARQTQSFDREVETSLVAARNYVDASSLPVGAGQEETRALPVSGEREADEEKTVQPVDQPAGIAAQHVVDSKTDGNEDG